MDCIGHYDSPFGGITCASDEDRLTGLWFDSQERFLDDASKKPKHRVGIGFSVRKWLDIYFSGKEPDFIPPLSMSGTEFRRAVWSILLSIPYGQIVTYGQIAAMMAKRLGVARMSARAIGGAVASNPILLIVPCHRVVGPGGAMTGYSAGTDKKARLLALEGISQA